MEDSVRKKLNEIYYRLRHTNILYAFIEQFGEENVDSNVPTFEQFIDSIKDLTPGRLGITRFSDSNSYGTYSMDEADYEKNGRGKPLIEYVPDLGMLDFLQPRLESMIKNGNTEFYILVHFPEVRISNEYGKYVDIQDLYAKVKFDNDGKLLGEMQLTRTTFPYSHFKAHYAHSHLPQVYKSDIGNWKSPCLGYGPLNDTQHTLRGTYDINIWGLFTYEISKYVTIESISGGPYIRLESIGKGDIADELCCFQMDNYHPICRNAELNKLLMRFIKYYAKQNKFKIKFVDGEYQYGEYPVDACIHLSNAFIQWYNKYGLSSGVTPAHLREIMKPYIIADGKIYYKHENDGVSVQDALDVNGRTLFRFKGEEVHLRILVNNSMIENDNTYILFNNIVLNRIVSYVLDLINLKHSKSNGKRRKNPQEDQETRDTSGEKFYIF